MYNETAVHIEWIKFSYISIYMYREWKWKFNCGVPAWYGWNLLVCLWYLPHTYLLCSDCKTKCHSFHSCLWRWWQWSTFCGCVHLHWCYLFWWYCHYYNKHFLLHEQDVLPSGRLRFVCVCVCTKWACVHICMCSCEQADRQVKVRAYMCACMRTNLSCLLLPLYTPVLYLQVLLLLLHSAQLSQLPSHYPLNGHLESLIQVHVIFCSTFICTTYIMMHG